MLIEVTQQHIDSGRQCNTGTCPVALALTGKLPGVRSVGVWLDRDGDPQAVFRGVIDLRRALPATAGSFIEAFDTHGPTAVQPFTFTLPTMPEWMTRG